MMGILRTIVTGLAVAFCAVSRPLGPNEAGRLAARDASASNVPAPDLGDMGNAAVSNWTNTQITQLGVVVENLELYAVGRILDRYSESDFIAAGYPSWVRARMMQLQAHDQAHHDYLAAILDAVNATVPLPCQYPLIDTLLSLGLETNIISLCGIEQVAASAYLGFEPYLHEAAENTAVAQYASAEARHQGWILASALSEEPWSGPWDTALTPDQTLGFLPFYSSSCPASNPEFPQTTWPPVNIVGPISTPEYDGPPGLPAQINYSGILDTQDGETWINIQSGLGVQIIPVGYNGTITVPDDFRGFSFGMVVSTNETRYTADQIVAGPVGFHNGFNSSASNPGLKPLLPDALAAN